jgi:hypothetical protein
MFSGQHTCVPLVGNAAQPPRGSVRATTVAANAKRGGTQSAIVKPYEILMTDFWLLMLGDYTLSKQPWNLGGAATWRLLDPWCAARTIYAGLQPLALGVL